MLDALTTWPPQALQIAGFAGFMLYVTNYLLVTFKWIHSDQIRFFVLNWIAASLVLLGLLDTFNPASAMIQVFWIGISSAGILLRLRRRRPAPVFFTQRSVQA